MTIDSYEKGDIVRLVENKHRLSFDKIAGPTAEDNVPMHDVMFGELNDGRRLERRSYLAEDLSRCKLKMAHVARLARIESDLSSCEHCTWIELGGHSVGQGEAGSERGENARSVVERRVHLSTTLLPCSLCSLSAHPSSTA